MTPPKSLQFQFAQLKVKMTWEGDFSPFPVDRYARWIDPAGDAPLSFRIQWVGTFPDIDRGERLFDAPGCWRMYRHEGGYFFEGERLLDDQGKEDESPHWGALISANLEKVDFFIHATEFASWELLFYRFLPIYFSALLPSKEGLLLHGLGMDIQKKGFLFLGLEGAGKTTLSQLWSESSKGRVLNDDRVIVRKIEGQWTLFGTPWWGGFEKFSPDGLPLERVYLISHGEENRIETFSGLEAFERLLKQIFLSYWKSETLTPTVGLCGELLEEFPIRSFKFIKDPSAVTFLLESLNNAPDSRPVLPVVEPI